MGVFDIFKKSSSTPKEEFVKNMFYLKEDPTVQIPYEIKGGTIHFGKLNMTTVLGVDLRIDNVRYRLCSWEGFHVFVLGLIAGWSAIEGMRQYSESLKKGSIPNRLKDESKELLEEVKMYEPPENFFIIRNKLEKIGQLETQKILKIKEILGNEKLLNAPFCDQLGFITSAIQQEKKLSVSTAQVAEVDSVVYKKPAFSIGLNNEKELKLVRCFIFQDKITPEHAKLILPILKDFLYSTIMNQPGVQVPKETIELEIKYFEDYIHVLEKAIEDNSTIEPLLFN